MLFKNINKGTEEFRKTPGAIRIDVREPGEFKGGHIPGAVNVPLSSVNKFSAPLDTPLFTYCLRGSRSSQAVHILKSMGYECVKSIGGITGYKGETER